MDGQPNEWVSIAGAADYLGCSRDTVRRLVGSGELTPIQFVPRGRLRFRSEDLEEFVRSRQRPRAGLAA